VIEEACSGSRITVLLPSPGEHQVLNAMQAVAVARGPGADPDTIETAFASYDPLPLRWEVLGLHGITLINDAYNANPMSMRASLRAFAEEPCAGAKWLVLGGMLELGAREQPEHLALGRFVAEGPWEGVLVVGALGGHIADGAQAAGFAPGRLVRCRDTRGAVSVLAERLGRTDTVLLKASRGFHFEEIAEQLQQREGTEHDGEHGSSAEAGP
jgi:UDP-N-acetylmuramoyl-tripeptide--D-alanyl-D-alanine ligase